MGPDFSDDPGASWKYPDVPRSDPEPPDRPHSGPHEDDTAGSWRCLGPDPVPAHCRPPGPAAERAVHSVFSVVGFVCAAVTLVSCIWPLGLIGVVLGAVGHFRGERLGKWAALAATAATAIGLVIVFWVAPSLHLHRHHR